MPADGGRTACVQLYGVTSPRSALPEPRGIDGAPVEYAAVAGLVLAASRHEVPPEPTRERLLAHHRVNLCLMEAGPVAPFRYAATFASLEAAQAALAAHAGRLAAVLPRLEGAVELSVKVLPAALPPPSALPDDGLPATGTQYLRRRQREFSQEAQRADALTRVAGRLNEALVGVVIDSRTQLLGQRVLALACLCSRSKVAEFQRVLRAVRAAEAECRFLFSGPWAPSSFVA